jgi:hypothetical protein
MPGRHPDDDLLADLAADVLPAERARGVEAHVMSCDRCAGLLEDAERVRSLLLSGDPGPVPVDVWHRIEAALAAVRDPSADALPESADSAGPGWAGERDPLDDTDPLDDADPLDDPERWGARPVGAGRASRGSRRDARADGPRRRGSILLAAAAVVAVVALVGSVKLMARNTSAGASLSAGSAQSSSTAPAGGGASTSRAPVMESGLDYRAATLAAQASALLAAATGALRPGSGGRPTTGGSASEAASPQAVAPGVTKFPAAKAPADTTAKDITNPARLAACLAALNVAPDRLVAVDLARYEGRDAAILLLRTPDGSGHEVWAVERTCAPGAEGALKYTRLSG